MTLAFIFMLCSLLVHAQTSIGLELSSLLCSEIRLVFQYKIAEHWAISAEAGVNYQILHRRISAVEAEHNSEFPINTLPDSNEFTHGECLCIRYWPQGAFNGAFLSFGAEYRDTNGLDASVGIGYMFKIWKGLYGTAKYNTGIIRAVKSEKLTLRDLSIGLSWNF